MRTFLVYVFVLSNLSHLHAETSYAPRSLYAILVAGGTYCPNLVEHPGVAVKIGYDPHRSGEPEKLIDEKNIWYDEFMKKPRATTCAQLLGRFGPGTAHHLFDKKS